MQVEGGRHTSAGVFGAAIVNRLRAVPMGGTIEIPKAQAEALLDKAAAAARGRILETGKSSKGARRTHADDLTDIIANGTGMFFGRKVKLT